MISGIGTDIVQIVRIKKAIINTQSFKETAFTKNEIEYFDLKKDNYETIAGTFAAKEAISKALGTGFRGFGLRDIEISHNKLGKPIACLSDKILEKFDLKNYAIHISISHTSDEAIAFAILEGGK